MTPPMSLTFRVRGYECDVYGHLNNVNYLRYRDHVDEQAPPAGLPLRDRIEYTRAVGPGSDVVATCTDEVEAEGHTRREYQFEDVDGRVAAASAEWLTDGGSDGGEPVAEAPPPPPGAFATDRPVEWRDVGAGGRVSPAGLASLAEDCGIRVTAAHGWPMTRCSAEGFAIVTRRIEAEYHTAAGLDDEIHIRTWISEVRRSTVVRHYLLARADGAPVARFRNLFVWADLETGRPIRIPEGFISDFAPNLA